MQTAKQLVQAFPVIDINSKEFKALSKIEQCRLVHAGFSKIAEQRDPEGWENVKAAVARNMVFVRPIVAKMFKAAEAKKKEQA